MVESILKATGMSFSVFTELACYFLISFHDKIGNEGDILRAMRNRATKIIKTVINTSLKKPLHLKHDQLEGIIIRLLLAELIKRSSRIHKKSARMDATDNMYTKFLLKYAFKELLREEKCIQSQKYSGSNHPTTLTLSQDLLGQLNKILECGSYKNMSDFVHRALAIFCEQYDKYGRPSVALNSIMDVAAIRNTSNIPAEELAMVAHHCLQKLLCAGEAGRSVSDIEARIQRLVGKELVYEVQEILIIYNMKH